MYKLGEKFVIEIGERYKTDMFKSNGEACTPNHLYRVKGFNSLTFTERELSKLEKYEGDAGYEKGLSDAWEVAKKIYDLSFSNTKEIYGEENDSLLKVMRNITPQEAIEKLKEWEEKQEIKVGDVIDVKDMGLLVVTHDSGGGIYDCLVIENLTGYTVTERNVFKKTGKHIDLTKIFKGLEGEDV